MEWLIRDSDREWCHTFGWFPVSFPAQLSQSLRSHRQFQHRKTNLSERQAKTLHPHRILVVTSNFGPEICTWDGATNPDFVTSRLKLSRIEEFIMILCHGRSIPASGTQKQFRARPLSTGKWNSQADFSIWEAAPHPQSL